jgi:hypothetical protein
MGISHGPNGEGLGVSLASQPVGWIAAREPVSNLVSLLNLVNLQLIWPDNLANYPDRPVHCRTIER